MNKNSLSFSIYIFLFLFFLSFLQIIFLPFLSDKLKYLLFEPYQSEKFSPFLEKICNHKEIKSADSNSLISKICLNKNIFTN